MEAAGHHAGVVAGGSNGGDSNGDLDRPAPAQRDDTLLLLLGVSIIAACCACWFLEHLDYLLKPLVFAVGLSLILRPFVDFLSDGRYQEQKLRRWNVKLPWSPRTVVVPRFVSVVLALSVVFLVSGTIIWALYLSEQWVQVHWRDKAWNDRFIARVNDLANFTDRIALRLLKRDDFALEAWHTLQSKTEETLKDEEFWTSFANNLFSYGGDVAICLFYVLFLLAPPRKPLRLRSTIVRRIHGAVKKFIFIMVALSAVRALLVGLLIWACGFPGSLSASIAIVSFWLFFIPNLGSFAATLLPLPLVVLLPDMTVNQRWCATFLPAMGSFLVGDILGPTVYRKGLDLNEVVILLSLVFWFSVWGGVGAVLAVPIMCTVKIVMEEIPHEGTHGLARLMAPARTHEDEEEGEDNPPHGEDGGGGGSDAGLRRRRGREADVGTVGWLRWSLNAVRGSRWYAKMVGAEGDGGDEGGFGGGGGGGGGGARERSMYSAIGEEDDASDARGDDLAAPLLGHHERAPSRRTRFAPGDD